MKVLITGGLGFIFSYVTEYLVDKGYEVVVIDNLSEGSHPEIIDDNFKLHKIDFSNNKSAIEVVKKESPDCIIHAAAITDVDYSIKHPFNVIRNNIGCNVNAFEAARRIPNLKKFIYVSTDEVYGECENPKNETELLFPRNPYSMSKAAGSLLRFAYDNTFPEMRDRTAEIRMCNIFGPRQNKSKIMPKIIKSLRKYYSIPLQEGGEGYREYLYVENIPPLIEIIMERGNRTYNITNKEGFTVKQLIEKAEIFTGKKILYHLSNRMGHDRRYMMDNTRIIHDLGWTPEINFEEGFKMYLEMELYND